MLALMAFLLYDSPANPITPQIPISVQDYV